MAAPEEERLVDEVALLEAMYPGQFTWDHHSREAIYKSDNSTMVLRLQEDYLTTGRPVVLSASAGKQDVSSEVKKRLLEFNPGEEVLDATIMVFEEVVVHYGFETSAAELDSAASVDLPNEGEATVVVWLHHLLNTNKRKLALSPAESVSGVTKPGYPGVLVYSGPANDVKEHVSELKGQNWAAFQIRLESQEAWTFTHGGGVKEVETMGDVVTEVGDARKEEFMQAIKIK